MIHQAADDLYVTPDPGWNMKVAPGVGRGFLVTWDDVNPAGGLFARRVRGRENEIVEGFEVDGFSVSVRPAAVALTEGLFLVVHERYDGRIAAGQGERTDIRSPASSTMPPPTSNAIQTMRSPVLESSQNDGQRPVMSPTSTYATPVIVPRTTRTFSAVTCRF